MTTDSFFSTFFICFFTVVSEFQICLSSSESAMWVARHKMRHVCVCVWVRVTCLKRVTHIQTRFSMITRIFFHGVSMITGIFFHNFEVYRYICVYVHIHIYIHIYRCRHMYIYIYTMIYTMMYIYIYVYTHGHICVYIYTFIHIYTMIVFF